MCKTEKSQKIKSPRKSNPPQHLRGCFEGVFVPDLTRLGMREGVFVPDLTRSGVRVRGLGLVWTSGPTRSDRDQRQTRSRTRHWNLTRLVSYVLLTSLMSRILWPMQTAPIWKIWQGGTLRRNFKYLQYVSVSVICQARNLSYLGVLESLCSAPPPLPPNLHIVFSTRRWHLDQDLTLLGKA